MLTATRLAAAIAFCSLSMTAWADNPQKPDEAKKSDSGKFNLTVMGKKVGTTTFKFDADGGSESSSDVEANGQSTKVKVTVKAKAGKMVGFGADAGPSNHFTATIEGDKVKIAINDAAPATQSLAAGALPFGNFSPHLMNYVLAAYDPKKADKPEAAKPDSKPDTTKPAKPVTQTITLALIEGLPGGMIANIQAKLTPTGTKEVKIDGKPQTVSLYDLVIAAGGQDIPVKLYANADKRLLAWEVPSQSYTAIREGFEEILK